MLVLVTGGAVSGKSEAAENICAALGQKRCYIATMRAYDGEALLRVKRHQDARAHKNFITVEQPASLHSLVLTGFDAGLLECLSNLLANEMFEEKIPPTAVSAHILKGIEHVLTQVPALVAVTNGIFAGAEQYGGEMREYLRCLGALNRALAQKADIVIESVCGLPLVIKGEELLEKRC